MAHLEQINMLDLVVTHDVTDSRDRAHNVLGILEEEVRHCISLQVKLLLYMAGGIARHDWIVAELELAWFCAYCCWNDLNLRTYSSVACQS